MSWELYSTNASVWIVLYLSLMVCHGQKANTFCIVLHQDPKFLIMDWPYATSVTLPAVLSLWKIINNKELYVFEVHFTF